MNIKKSEIPPIARITRRLAHFGIAAFVFCLLLAFNSRADTLYWTGGTGNWSTATTDVFWSIAPELAPSTYWINGNAAEIISTNPEIHLWNAVATSVTIQNGLTLYAAGGGNVNRSLAITSGGSGNLTLRDDRTSGGTTLRIQLQGSTPWNGTFTIYGSSTSDVSLIAASEIGNSPNSVGTQTKIHLVDGGKFGVGPGIIGGNATIGELSGSGSVGILSAFSSTTGTRTLKVNQVTDTSFSGTLGVGLNRTDNIFAFTKSGSGTLSISGTGGYEGATTVEEGQLFFNGTYGIGTNGTTGQGNYIVKNGALLGANGTLSLSTGATARNVIVEAGGTLKAGEIDSAGTLTISGGNSSSDGLVFHDGAIVELRLGAERDFIQLSTATMKGQALGGEGSIVFNLINNGGIILNETYDLINFGGTTAGIALNAFALSAESIAAGWQGDFSYGGDGNLLQFTVAAIPEPTVSFIFFGSAAFFGFLQRLRKRRENSQE